MVSRNSKLLPLIMAKLALFPVLLGVAMLAAGLFGALHNQISYTVSPDYFHQFKFHQFRIPPDTPARLGAASVGWQASWWMGALVGLPAFVLGLVLLRPAQAYWQAGFRAVKAVVLTAAVAAGIGLLLGYLVIDDQIAERIQVPAHISDPVQFMRAGSMHDASYIGGFLGLFISLWIIVRARARQ